MVRPGAYDRAMVRRTGLPRCDGCGVIPRRCVCKAVGRCELPWPMLVVQHAKEGHRPTNTVRLLSRVVADCRVVPFALIDRPWSAELLGEPHAARWVLFPGANATLLDPASLTALVEARAPLVVLDGSWRQAGRMMRRGTGLNTLPHFALPPGPPSRWSVRRAPHVGQLCTLEAIVRLASLLPDPEPARILEDAFLRLHAAQTGVALPLA